MHAVRLRLAVSVHVCEWLWVHEACGLKSTATCRTSSGAPGGNAVTVTARLVLDGDHCRLIEEWTGQVSCTAFRRTACIARAHGVQTAPAAMVRVLLRAATRRQLSRP
ncbi:MAG: hypothetical protein ACPIOQ_54545 [Promethearchaeia archaeon]